MFPATSPINRGPVINLSANSESVPRNTPMHGIVFTPISTTTRDGATIITYRYISPNSTTINPEIINIKNLLNSSTVHVNFIGTRYLVGNHGSIEIGAMAERLKKISEQFPFNETDSDTGLECLNKMREFYRLSDETIIGRIRYVFDGALAILYAVLRYFGYSISDSPRDCIFGDGNYSVGPESIEMNFHRI